MGISRNYLSNLNLAYDLFENEAEVTLTFIQVDGGGLVSIRRIPIDLAANKLDANANTDVDFIDQQTVSPYRDAVLGSTAGTQTNSSIYNNIVLFQHQVMLSLMLDISILLITSTIYWSTSQPMVIFAGLMARCNQYCSCYQQVKEEVF